MAETVIPRSLPDVLYHFTLSQNVSSIMHSGLKPSRDRLGNPPAVWMNTDPVALAGRTLLEVRTAGLDRKKFVVFKDHPDGPFIYSGTVPPGNIQPLHSTMELSRLEELSKLVRR